MSRDVYPSVARRAATVLVVWQGVLVLLSVALVLRANSIVSVAIAGAWCSVVTVAFLGLLHKFAKLLK